MTNSDSWQETFLVGRLKLKIEGKGTLSLTTGRQDKFGKERKNYKMIGFEKKEDIMRVRRVQEKKRGCRSRGFEQPKWYTDLALIGQEET